MRACGAKMYAYGATWELTRAALLEWTRVLSGPAPAPCTGGCATCLYSLSQGRFGTLHRRLRGGGGGGSHSPPPTARQHPV